MPALVLGQPFETYSDALFQFSSSARAVDLVDVGVPVIINRQLRSNYRRLERLGVVVDAADVFAGGSGRMLRAMLDDPNLLTKLEAARASLSLPRHIWRLERFYERLAKSERVERSSRAHEELQISVDFA